MEHIVDIPAATLDYDQILAESDPLKRDALLDEADWQKELQRSAWERIVTAPRFAALMFEQRGDWPLTLILHPSTRPGIDLQLSRFDWAGRPEGHGDFFILLMARKPQPAESVGDESPNGLSAEFTIIFTLGLFFALRLNVLVDSLNISSSSCCHKIALSPQRTSP